MPEFPVFKGNCPNNVNKDAKYTVRSGPTGPIVSITYNTRDGEKWYASTELHPELVAMVNAVKSSHGGGLNGSFYINEYQQVVVPVVGSSAYYLGGSYSKRLRFEFEGKILSGEPIDWQGNPLSPGDAWVGPHPGIPYKLKAGGKDIEYSFSPRPNVEKTVLLSKVIDPAKASLTAAKIREHKGYNGGRFYVNEFRSIFAPVKEGNEYQYVYVGELNLDNWFPMPA